MADCNPGRLKPEIAPLPCSSALGIALQKPSARDTVAKTRLNPTCGVCDVVVGRSRSLPEPSLRPTTPACNLLAKQPTFRGESCLLRSPRTIAFISRCAQRQTQTNWLVVDGALCHRARRVLSERPSAILRSRGLTRGSPPMSAPTSATRPASPRMDLWTWRSGPRGGRNQCEADAPIRRTSARRATKQTFERQTCSPTTFRHPRNHQQGSRDGGPRSRSQRPTLSPQPQKKWRQT